MITGRNAPRAYSEALWNLKASYINENSRNGPVRRFPDPVYLTIQRPTERVLFCPVRDANPFFHMMEAVWMLAGQNEVEWLTQFNKNIANYADDGILRGAYGWRWKKGDQISQCIKLLKEHPNTRQAVLQMWDPAYDMPAAHTKDRPCNTQIYFEAKGFCLDMYVMNRSNDLIWGMLGANVVHMTILHEIIARNAGMLPGVYHVFSKNVHMYKNMPRFDELWNSLYQYDHYKEDDVNPYPINEDYVDLARGCEYFVKSGEITGVDWIDEVVAPMHDAWDSHRRGHTENAIEMCEHIEASDWRLACKEWLERRIT